MSHLFAFLARLKFIKRWGLMHSNYPENVQEHSARVAMIAHGLAIISNEVCGQNVDIHRVTTHALFHDATEVMTGDLPTPVKYHNEAMRDAYKGLERQALDSLLATAPAEFRPHYEEALTGPVDDHERKLIRAADKLCAYIKCREERRAGNLEFTKAEGALKTAIEALALPETNYFMTHYLPSFALTLDEMQAGPDAST